MQVADEGNDLEFWNDADFFDGMQEEQDSRFLWSASDVSCQQSGIMSNNNRSIVSASTLGFRRGDTSSSQCKNGLECSAVQEYESQCRREEMAAVDENIDINQNEGGPFSDVTLDQPGLHVWSIEESELVCQDKNDFGFFHEGACYVVLRVNNDHTAALHYWIGQNAVPNDIKVVERSCWRLDEIVCRATIYSRETQNYESVCFMRNFPDGIVYIEGKPKASVRIAYKYTKRLYVIRGRKYVRVACKYPRLDELDSGATALLDGFPRMYLWIGASCDKICRSKAIEAVRKFRTWQRKGKAHIVVVEQDDITQNAAFTRKLCYIESVEGSSSYADFFITPPPKENNSSLIDLYRVSGDRVLYDMPFAATRPLLQRYLVTTDSYLLDRGPDLPLFIWVGAKAEKDVVVKAVTRGKMFAEHRKYPTSVSVCRILEDWEPLAFRMAFLEWRHKGPTKLLQTRIYSVGNIGRVLSSRACPRLLAKATEMWPEDQNLNPNGTTEVFVVQEKSLEKVCEQPGVFVNSNCYIIWYRPTATSISESYPSNVLFYWMGRKSEPNRQMTAYKLCLNMSNTLQTALMMRVFDEKEPQNLLSAFQNSMIVYDADVLAEESDVTLYCVRECANNSIRVQQMPAKASSLNSSASFILLTPTQCVLWYGKLTGSSEREFSKTMLGFLDPARMYTYDIATEGREPSSFWEILGGRASYEDQYYRHTISRRPPRLSLCRCSQDNSVFQDIPDFDQEDLDESDVYILDTFDQVFVWCGRDVKSEYKNDNLHNFFKDYLAQDPAGRTDEEVNVWIVTQDNEPSAFRRYFSSWGPDGYGGDDSYNMARKRLRQENAWIDGDCQVVDTTYRSTPKHPYKTLLRSKLPQDVLEDHREHHLTDKNFTSALKLSRLEFYRLPEWKQVQILKSARLAYLPPVQPASPVTAKRLISTRN